VPLKAIRDRARNVETSWSLAAAIPLLAVGMALLRSGSEVVDRHPVRTGVGMPQRRL
jgi:hypothetical protein